MRFVLVLSLSVWVSSLLAHTDVEDYSLFPEQVASIEADNDSLILGLISPISGQISLRSKDLVAKGPQDLVLNRTYVSCYLPSSFDNEEKFKKGYKKWELAKFFFHNHIGWQIHGHLEVLYDPRSQIVHLKDSSGASLPFKRVGDHLRFEKEPYGISNLHGHRPQRYTDPRHIKGEFVHSSLGLIVNLPDGTIRYYQKAPLSFMQAPLVSYELVKETLPSGRHLCYHASKDGLKVSLLDPSLKLSYTELLRSECSDFVRVWQTKDKKAHFTLKPSKITGTVKTKKTKGHFTHPIDHLISSASTPFNRSETISYTPQHLIQSVDNRDHQFQLCYKAFGSPSFFRVSEIIFPLEEGSIKATLDYVPAVAGISSGITTVHFDDGSSIKYHISEKLLLNAIEHIDPSGSILRKKHFRWLPNHQIDSIAMLDGDDRCLFETTYSYDERGNPIKETIFGDLTGSGSKEAYSIVKAYSDNRFCHLVLETHDNGKTIAYTYLPDTNLLTSKITSDREKILLREFYLYDAHHNLISELLDDGSSLDPYQLDNVTNRKMRNYKLRQHEPFLHMIEAIEEYGLLDQKMQLIRSKKLSYDAYGNIIKEDVFDSSSHFLYATAYTYNERGDVVSKSDPLGYTSHYGYDAKGMQIFSKKGSGRLVTSSEYDKKGRCISKLEVGDDTQSQQYLYSYDAQDRLIKEQDPFCNVRGFEYPAFLNKPSLEILPDVETFSGQGQNVIKVKSYDSLGNKIKETCPLGHTTSFSYNARGQVTLITHPNGAFEDYRYHLDGSLDSYTDQEGLKKEYSYDVLGHLIRVDELSSKGQLLTREHFEYKGDKLVLSQAKEGQRTLFVYDGAGRKIKEDVEGRVKEYVYNDLDQLIKIIHHNGENTLVINYKKDFLDQVLFEERTDLQGRCLFKKSYSYDADGNTVSSTEYIHNKPSISYFAFDPFRRCRASINPEGDKTCYSYDDKTKNTLGQGCFSVTKINPKGVKTLSVYNPFGKLVSRQTLDAQGVLIASSKNIYDASSNLTYHIDDVYENGRYIETQTVKNTYNSLNLLESSIRAYQTQDETLTSYSYTPSGKLLSKTLPSKVQLNYVYNELGYLKSLKSSDGLIDHSFSYNLVGDLLKAHDHISGCGFKRSLNLFGEVEKEEFSTGVTVERSFDQRGRPLQLKLKRGGEITCIYDPQYLKKVIRTTRDNQSYSHTFDEYDQSGLLLKETLPKELGTRIKGYDRCGRLSKISSPYLELSYLYDSMSNPVLKETEDAKIHYDYDSLDQLIKEGIVETRYDSLYNRHDTTTGGLNQLLDVSYDTLGNVKKHNGWSLIYDPLNRLIQANKLDKCIKFSYDPLGRCLIRTAALKELYLYDGAEEIGSMNESLELTSFKVMAPSQEMLAIESNQELFSVELDPFSNTQKLLGITNPSSSYEYDVGAFGGGLQSGAHRWVYKGKRFDEDLALVNFGARFYDPCTARWMSLDPRGFLDSYNLYQYVFNNPYKFKDPTGEFIIAIPLLVWGSELVISTLAAWAAPALYAGASAAFVYAGYKYAETLSERSYASRRYGECALYTEAVYAPDRELPNSPDGIHIPDTDAPHTQLGIKEGRKSKYPQAREFDGAGTPIRDIDFTDHGRPKNHPNPHQHLHIPNPTGGTLMRDPKAQPVEHWNYNER